MALDPAAGFLWFHQKPGFCLVSVRLEVPRVFCCDFFVLVPPGAESVGYIGSSSWRDSGAESVGYIGGSSWRDSGAESVGYIGGSSWRETGAESVGYMGERSWWRRRRRTWVEEADVT